ncbi:DNA polymerase IV [Marinobacter nanhaiticus D15-8W]|uniref:DNA polymerase IV n=1 Tax=Marinobacter nanhaiticus D15-8W TaxID=626887 RepID=N6W2H6_9GAMM|nr:DNA polymerase IV [Marinobacter nanhaiticus]ENO16725.1 DNA polymerase IV [Marinobacter nanhaiticus D15-8W]BES72530.1 DNA polymerase IV [Marinobacter nanhaiticus D15-8W]
MADRKIIHLDCDCFYAAVEMRDDPTLRNVPLAVGGAGPRGVVTTCNYLAREYGIRSAMPGAEARRRCPDLVTVPVDMQRYRRVSRQVMDIFRELTDRLEPLSLDEAFLDVTDVSEHHGSATLMARYLRQRVHDEVGITVSAGVAPNKFLAKIASDWQKPDGLFVIRPEDVADFVMTLPVEKLFGVGKVTAGKLHAMGATTCGELQGFTQDQLVDRFGRHGARLFHMARGEDNRPVVITRIAKSVSVERTFSEDLPNREACYRVMEKLVEDLERRLERKAERKPIHKLFVKIRYSDFSTHTLERVRENIEVPGVEDFQPLVEALYTDASRPVRLLGLGVRFREEEAPTQQLRLFE